MTTQHEQLSRDLADIGLLNWRQRDGAISRRGKMVILRLIAFCRSSTDDEMRVEIELDPLAPLKEVHESSIMAMRVTSLALSQHGRPAIQEAAADAWERLSAPRLSSDDLAGQEFLIYMQADHSLRLVERLVTDERGRACSTRKVPSNARLLVSPGRQATLPGHQTATASVPARRAATQLARILRPDQASEYVALSPSSQESRGLVTVEYPFLGDERLTATLTGNLGDRKCEFTVCSEAADLNGASINILFGDKRARVTLTSGGGDYRGQVILERPLEALLACEPQVEVESPPQPLIQTVNSRATVVDFRYIGYAGMSGTGTAMPEVLRHRFGEWEVHITQREGRLVIWDFLIDASQAETACARFCLLDSSTNKPRLQQLVPLLLVEHCGQSKRMGSVDMHPAELGGIPAGQLPYELHLVTPADLSTAEKEELRNLIAQHQHGSDVWQRLTQLLQQCSSGT